MTIWHEDRLLIDGELVPAERRRDVRDDRSHDGGGPRCLRRCERRRCPTAGWTAARRAFDTTNWSRRTRPAPARAAWAPPGSARQRRGHLREIIVHEVRTPVSITHWSATRRPRSTSSGGTPTCSRATTSSRTSVSRDTFAGRHRRWVEKEAAGVVGTIAAYNYPVQPHARQAGARTGRGMHGRAEGRTRHAVGDPRARQARRGGDRDPSGRRERPRVVRQRRGARS